MASYTSPDISGYNSNPPSDDGTESTSNRIDWSTIKNKLNDPTKTYSEAIDSATTSAFTTVDGQIADGSAWYAADTGAADAYVVTLSPAVTSNVVGRKTSFKATNTNTGASTLNLNVIGAESIKNNNGNALVAGDITATRIYTVTWDGTNYILDVQSPENKFVNNANGNPNISDDAITISTVATVSTWESIGPTGSGADNIWDDLDSLPAVDWIEVKVYIKATGTATSIAASLNARAAGASDETSGIDNLIATISQKDGDADAKEAATVTTAKIPVGTGNIFDVYYTEVGTAAPIALYLTGYGFN